MKICLKNTRTGNYLDETGKWENDLTRARMFNKTSEALSFCLENGLTNVVVVVAIGGTQVEMEISDVKRVYSTKACYYEFLSPVT